MITPQQYHDMLTRLNKGQVRDGKPPDDAVDHESDLHDEITAECRRRGWGFIHSRMDKPSTVGVGVCDFAIFGGGQVFLLEAKTKTGKRTPAQLAFAALMRHNSFTVHVVRSMSEVLAVFDAGRDEA